MLTVNELLSLNVMPPEDEISLQTIAEFFELHMCSKTYIYRIKDKNYPEVTIQFKTGDLPHLLGIHDIKKSFAGDLGFDGLKNGQITFASLHEANPGAYKSKLFRMLYFPFVYQLMQQPKFIVFDPKRQPSMMKLTFELYGKHAESFIHLGIDLKAKQSNGFFARTFGFNRNDVSYKRHKHIPITEIMIVQR